MITESSNASIVWTTPERFSTRRPIKLALTARSQPALSFWTSGAMAPIEAAQASASYAASSAARQSTVTWLR